MILDDELDVEEQDEQDEQDGWDWLAEAIEDGETDEGVKRYLVSIREARRKMQRRTWDKENIRTVSTRVSAEEARRFHRLCRDMGTTRYKVLAGYIRYMLDHHGY